MATYTTNYNFKKPDGVDPVQIADINNNFENLDIILKNIVDSKANAPVYLVGTLSAGSTSLTLTNSAITSESFIDIYTTIYGVNPTAVTVGTGTITMTFDAQTSDINVKVVIS